MRKIVLSILVTLISFSFLSCANSADEKIEEKGSGRDYYDGMLLNFFTGQFDFSDHKQSAALIGLEHQDETLYRNTFLGKLSPLTGVFYLPKHNAYYLYTGVQANYDLGPLTITPSFAPGLYDKGASGKELGHPLEFKSEIQASLDLGKSSRLGMSYNHISNASLGFKNPGANSYMFNFLKQF